VERRTVAGACAQSHAYHADHAVALCVARNHSAPGTVETRYNNSNMLAIIVLFSRLVDGLEHAEDWTAVSRFLVERDGARSGEEIVSDDSNLPLPGLESGPHPGSNEACTTPTALAQQLQCNPSRINRTFEMQRQRRAHFSSRLGCW